MLKLDNYITLDAKAIASPNLCDRFSDEDLARTGEPDLESLRRRAARRRPPTT